MSVPPSSPPDPQPDSQPDSKPGDSLAELAEVMRRLRAECAWTAQQTHASLAPYVLEEAGEVVEAIETGPPDQLRDELGDLLMQVFFHAALAEERGEYDVEDVAAGIVAKLKRRNPHVYADGTARTPEEIAEAWEEIKRAERQAGSGTRSD